MPNKIGLELLDWAVPLQSDLDDQWQSVLDRAKVKYEPMNDVEFLELAKIFFHTALDLAPFLAECRSRNGRLEDLLPKLGFDRRSKNVPGFMRTVFNFLESKSNGATFSEISKNLETSPDITEFTDSVLEHWLIGMAKFFQYNERWYLTQNFRNVFKDISAPSAKLVLVSLISKALEDHSGGATIGTIMKTLFGDFDPSRSADLRETIRELSRDMGLTIQNEKVMNPEGNQTEGRYIADDIRSFARYFALMLEKTGVEVEVKKPKS